MGCVKRRISTPAPPFKIGRLALEITLSCYQEHEYCWQHTVIKSLQKTAEAILCTLFECSVMAMAHCKHVTVNINNMKLVLGISAKIRLNYFGLIDAPDYSTPATTIHHLCAAPALSTTAAAASLSLPLPTITFLPPSGTVRVSTHQIVDIRAPVWFTKPVLEKQEKKEEEKKKKREKKDNDDDKNNDNDD
ncbi:uncharacterized protein CIMG_13094 [Coccidioides immitis RS]|uniref:Histone H3 n=1 Tax=Coccidioides immitis (strain RS) TaxID=246410 RepID=A0A0E1S252_COCIM|nr:uncharacterized protein CIMG_13094 [Coccidioides immitis RS]EAS31477.2 hypothetical protein CIMG_13094 [Coccidioides immitis RS]